MAKTTVINNVSKHTKEDTTLTYIVARKVDNEFWFWGAWRDFEKALSAAESLGNGFVFPREQVAL